MNKINTFPSIDRHFEYANMKDEWREPSFIRHLVGVRTTTNTVTS